MNGAVMVLPREGLTDGKGNPLHYDKAAYIGEQDMYVPKMRRANTSPTILRAKPIPTQSR
jgi:nitrite reductase (NO-forming)